MSAKSDVSDFLQLGAQYEIILAGLFDELTTQRKTTTGLEKEMSSNLRQINSSLQTMRELEGNSQDALRRVEIGLSAVREIELSFAAITQSIDISKLVLSDLQETIDKNQLRQRWINNFLLSYTLLGSVMALVIWLVKF